MTTATPPRHQQPMMPRPGSAPGGGGVGGMAPIDPIKMIKQYAPLLVICAVIGLALGVAAHLVLVRVAPKYSSFVLYEISPPQADIKKVNEDQNFNQEEHTRFMGTQKAIMVSEAVVQAAVRAPEVWETEWAKPFMSRGSINVPAASRELEKNLSARDISNTNIIRLSMSGGNATDVATIVNAVNRAYLEDIRQQDNRVTADQREALSALLKGTRETIARLEGQRDSLVTDGGLDAIEAQASSANMEIFELGRQKAEVEAAIAGRRSILESYAAMIEQGRVVQYPDRLREAANQDLLIRNIDSEIAGLHADERALKLQGFGDNHPSVKQIRTYIEAKKQERQAKFEQTLRQLFDADVDAMRSGLASFEAQLKSIEERMVVAQKKKEEALSARLRAEQLALQIEVNTRQANELDTTIKTMDSKRELKVANRVRVLRTGQIPTNVSFPKAIVIVPLGLVLLPTLVGGIVLLRELFDQRVRGPADIAIIPRLRVLGVIPNASEDPARPANVATAFRDSPTGAITESYRQLKAPLAKRMDQMGYKSLLVVSGMPGSGGTSVVTNLAMIAAASDQRVLIIDANLRRPGVHKVFGLQEGPGLGDVLEGSATMDSAVQATSVANLSVLGAGSGASRRMPERLTTETMSALIRDAGAVYDLVLIDAAPAIVSGDGLALANRCDAVVLVVRALSEKRGLVARLQNQFGDTRAELLGIILNAARSSAGGYFRRNIKATHEYQKAAKA